MQFPFELGTWIILIPIALALGVLSVAGSRESGTSSAASTQRPEEPDKRGRPGRLARWRARRGVRHGWNRWTIGFSNPIRPATVHLAELRHHALVCGATGSGKTSALQLLVDAFADQLPLVVVDCKASAGLQEHIRALSNAAVWTIGGNVRWDPLRGDATSVANRLIQGEWFSRDGDIYRATGERYLLWVLQAIDLAKLQRTPELVLQYLEPTILLTLLRGLDGSDAARLAGQVARLGQTEKEGIAGIRARFGLVLEGVAAPSLGPGVALEDALRARQPVLFSLDAATYPELATKIGAWILLDLVRVAALRPGPCLVIVDEFSALGREGRHVVPLLARSRESGMACVLATQGLADLARVDRDLPQQIAQNTAVRLALRQGSADDQEAWSALLGGAPLPFAGSGYVHRERARAVSPDELAMLRTGEAFLQVMPGATDGRRQRLWIAAPRTLGRTLPNSDAPNCERRDNTSASRSAEVRTGRDWVWPDAVGSAPFQQRVDTRAMGFEWTDWRAPEPASRLDVSAAQWPSPEAGEGRQHVPEAQSEAANSSGSTPVSSGSGRPARQEAKRKSAGPKAHTPPRPAPSMARPAAPAEPEQTTPAQSSATRLHGARPPRARAAERPPSTRPEPESTTGE